MHGDRRCSTPVRESKLAIIIRNNEHSGICLQRTSLKQLDMYFTKNEGKILFSVHTDMQLGL